MALKKATASTTTKTKPAAKGGTKAGKAAETANPVPSKAKIKPAVATKAVPGIVPAARPADVAKPATTAKAAPVVTVKHLAASLAEQEQLPAKQATALVTGLVDLLVDHLKKGDRLRIAGFGILEVRSRPARTGRNPATGEAIQIKASKKIAFRAAKDLKEAV